MGIVITDGAGRSNPYLDKIKLVRGDITQQNVDGVFSLMPHTLDYHGSINKSIVAVAGPALDEFVLEHIYQPQIGDVYAVPGFNLPASNVIYAFRPPWKNDFEREDKHLLSCVRKAMVLAKCMLLRRVAIPPIGASPRRGYGPKRSARIVLQGIVDRLDKQFDEVIIVCNSDETYNAYRERLVAMGWSGV